ncbi:TIM23 complex component [Tulasnella sp. 419]|nr:TIM23 complex component [Tulasnella sp. 418]KAG8961544.1 TIM23 complex component [Tulasnella sp. 419]
MKTGPDCNFDETPQERNFLHDVQFDSGTVPKLPATTLTSMASSLRSSATCLARHNGNHILSAGHLSSRGVWVVTAARATPGNTKQYTTSSEGSSGNESLQSTANETQQPENLPWPKYFQIRKNKRTWEMATTVPTSIVGLAGGAAYFGSLDGTGLIMGIDPIFVYGLATFGCMGLGWLLGPFVGGTFWRMSHRKALASIEQRDKEFHHHLVKNRADPSRQSAMNPVPDFYGEKIGSLAQYRQWLRDQGKYRRKSIWPEDL